VIELSKAFDEEDFDKFDRKRVPKVRLPSVFSFQSFGYRAVLQCIRSVMHNPRQGLALGDVAKRLFR
jgi:hypothetical protein